jgi:hypothetical protein
MARTTYKVGSSEISIDADDIGQIHISATNGPLPAVILEEDFCGVHKAIQVQRLSKNWQLSQVPLETPSKKCCYRDSDGDDRDFLAEEYGSGDLWAIGLEPRCGGGRLFLSPEILKKVIASIENEHKASLCKVAKVYLNPKDAADVRKYGREHLEPADKMAYEKGAVGYLNGTKVRIRASSCVEVGYLYYVTAYKDRDDYEYLVTLEDPAHEWTGQAEHKVRLPIDCCFCPRRGSGLCTLAPKAVKTPFTKKQGPLEFNVLNGPNVDSTVRPADWPHCCQITPQILTNLFLSAESLVGPQAGSVVKAYFNTSDAADIRKFDDRYLLRGESDYYIGTFEGMRGKVGLQISDYVPTGYAAIIFQAGAASDARYVKFLSNLRGWNSPNRYLVKIPVYPRP